MHVPACRARPDHQSTPVAGPHGCVRTSLGSASTATERVAGTLTLIHRPTRTGRTASTPARGTYRGTDRGTHPSLQLPHSHISCDGRA